MGKSNYDNILYNIKNINNIDELNLSDYQIASDYNIYDTIIEDEYEGLTVKDFLKLKHWYNIIGKIDDYKTKEKELYNKVSANNKEEKIFFELKRIFKHASNNHLTEKEYVTINYLLKYYAFILKKDSIKPEKLEEYYNRLINLIIKTEIKFDMRIGLYEEYINYFEQYLDYYGKKNESINQINKYLKSK